MEKDQRIRDPIYDLIKFSESDRYDCALWSLLQSRPCQRLRRIKQLGFSEFVYPGATHSRFSHVVGATQVARQMLDVFQRNDVLPASSDHRKMRAATLAAVLLHDIGHGPYSHVFEEISETMGYHKTHEEITMEIIQSDEIASILSKYRLLEKVVSFFARDNPLNPYASILSSQLDADRLDFLSRDRYFTGIQQGQIDLAWLLDSLRVENVPFGPEAAQSKLSFVVVQKGLGALEEYVSAYLKLYESIYFHKTTRGIQFLVQHALSDAFSDITKLKKKGIKNPLIEYFSAPPRERLARYLRLDDSDVIALLKGLSRIRFGRASGFSQRFLERQALKCFEPNDPNREPDLIRTRTFRERLNDTKVWFHMDIPKPKGFKQYEVMDENFLKNIMIKVDKNQTRALGEIRSNIPYKTQNHIRFYFESEEDRAKAQRLWKKL